MTISAAADVLAQSSEDSIIDEALTVSDWIQAGIIVAATISASPPTSTPAPPCCAASTGS